MPVSAFTTLFKSMPQNKLLAEKQLHLKTLTVLALELPTSHHIRSPMTMCFILASDECSQPIYVAVSAGWGLYTLFHSFGIKNDSARTGFDTHLSPASDSRIDPVITLQDHIARTVHTTEVVWVQSVWRSNPPSNL